MGGFLDFFPMYCVQHCFICRPSDSTVSENAGIELLPWQSEALTTRLDLLRRTEELLTKRMIKDVFILVSVPDVLMNLNMKLYQRINVLLYHLFI
jgi:hypothetical protein